MFNRLRWWWKLRRMTPVERVALSKTLSVESIRLHMRALGYNIDDLTDEDIEAGVKHLAQLVASTGVSAAEASEALVYLARVRI